MKWASLYAGGVSYSRLNYSLHFIFQHVAFNLVGLYTGKNKGQKMPKYKQYNQAEDTGEV